MNITPEVERDALIRELEHTIEGECSSIIQKLNFISNNSNINAGNFISMTYLLEALEKINDAATVACTSIVADSLTDKLGISSKSKINILDE